MELLPPIFITPTIRWASLVGGVLGTAIVFHLGFECSWIFVTTLILWGYALEYSVQRAASRDGSNPWKSVFIVGGFLALITMPTEEDTPEAVLVAVLVTTTAYVAASMLRRWFHR